MAPLRVNLGPAVLVSTILVVLLFGSINFHWVRREMTRILARELETRALHHADSLALQVMEAMLVDDRLRLNLLLEETGSLDKEIAYIFLVDARGSLAAHTFTDGFPVELLTANPLPRDRDYMVRRIIDKRGREGPVRDVVAPVANGYAGFVHVGHREQMIQEGVREAGRAVAGMVGLLILLGVAASFLFTRVVTYPLRRLAGVASQMNLEELSDAQRKLSELGSKAALPGLETEVDRLAHEFDRMVGRLAGAYRELEETQDQLVSAERLSAIGIMAAGLAHELNNPLAGLSNCLKRIQRVPENHEQLLRYVTLMQESTERMQRVLRGLLDLSRPLRPDMKWVPLEPLLDRVISLGEHKIEEIRSAPNKEIHEGASVVWADELLLEQALLNLVLNACDSLVQRKQSEPGFQPRLTLRAACRNPHVHIEVADNGLGINPEDVPRLFDPFFTTKAPGQGTGLGLSIARNTIRAQGGDIEWESQRGEGTTFRIVLNVHDGTGVEVA